MKNCVLANMYYFPREEVDIRLVKKTYERRMFDEKACRRCEYRDQRYDPATCGECPAHHGNVVTWVSRMTADGEYIGLPRGDIANFYDAGINIAEWTVEDLRAGPAMDLQGITVTAELTGQQQEVLDQVLSGQAMLDAGGFQEPYGLIVCPPRTGKTLILIAICLALGVKTIVLAKQDDLLVQFIKDLEKHTNIKDVCFTAGYKNYGIVKTADGIQELDIALCTYQSLGHAITGKDRLRQIVNSKGLVLVDEAHRAAAEVFSQVVNAFNSWYKIGTTATDKRKDELDFRVKQIVGPVTAQGSTRALRPTPTIHFTGATHATPKRDWVNAMKSLANNKKREKYILSLIEKDVKELGNKVMVPVIFRGQAERLVEKLIKMGMTAEAFLGGSDREDFLIRANNGEIDVTVGIRSIISEGINVSPWSAIHIISPIANPPNFYQETQRVCTPMEGKDRAFIRLYVDDTSESIGCFRTCWTETLAEYKDMCDETTLERVRIAFSMGRKGAEGQYVAGVPVAEEPEADAFKSRFKRIV